VSWQLFEPGTSPIQIYSVTDTSYCPLLMLKEVVHIVTTIKGSVVTVCQHLALNMDIES